MWNIESSLPIQLAVIKVTGVSVSQDKKAFDCLVQCAIDYKTKNEGKAISDVEGVQDARRLFRAIGLDPTKHRPASEALLNRALKSKELYAVNTLVDVGNWCALDFLLPTCVYDLDKIQGDVMVRRGKENESYIGLNEREVNVHNRYVVADDSGPFGSPMTDAKRTAVGNSTKNCILVIYAPIDYDPGLLNGKADLFAQRTVDMCKGVIDSIELLTGNVA